MIVKCPIPVWLCPLVATFISKGLLVLPYENSMPWEERRCEMDIGSLDDVRSGEIIISVFRAGGLVGTTLSGLRLQAFHCVDVAESIGG